MKLIQTQTLSAATNTIEFTSIPQDFNHLIFLTSTRCTAAGTGQQAVLMYFNSGGGTWRSRELRGFGNAAGTGDSATPRVFYSPQSGTTVNTFNNGNIQIPNYTSIYNKTFLTQAVTENAAVAARAHLISGHWTGTSAISSVSFSHDTGNFEVGSTISLYGLKS